MLEDVRLYVATTTSRNVLKAVDDGLRKCQLRIALHVFEVTYIGILEIQERYHRELSSVHRHPCGVQVIRREDADADADEMEFVGECSAIKMQRS